jgi:hypothetical protein
MEKKKFPLPWFGHGGTGAIQSTAVSRHNSSARKVAKV